ncbi:related to F1F0-ATPase complex, subunit h [Ramularia collo-cygni]|uniref:Related to F1F0-ATPase complex, subunit h n=1 Tax=Ramularia collo-cygni TaxID=112498 RepID=A0A2D3UPD8_9PEZI|nr:related to F1F0-ATPase complex, subunit h [Ramularia collo-cygni]CZT15738.1 related to F1F0-ATPase complex, subunit h [Ramularia collo-cygni]
MFGQTLRASRQSLARAAVRPTSAVARRTFIAPTAVRQADLVQDMYLKELKAYKAPAIKANDSEGQVHKFSIPKTPVSPEEADLQNDLQAYEQQVPEVEGQAAEGAAAPVEDWWVEEAEEETSAKH